MKLIRAIIRSECLREVEIGLVGLGVKGVTAYEVRGFGEERGFFKLDFLLHVMIEVMVADEHAQQVVDTLVLRARTGLPGDGVVSILSVEGLVRIRTGESHPGAI